MLTVLPFIFIAHYSAFFEYLPAVGWFLYAATFLVMIRRAVAGFSHNVFLRRLSQAGLFLTVAAVLAPLHARETPKTHKLFMTVERPSREIVQALSELQPQFRRGAHVLFVEDPFPRDSYFLLYTTRLLYRDMTLEVERTVNHTVPPSKYFRYDAVFGFRSGRLIDLRKS